MYNVLSYLLLENIIAVIFSIIAGSFFVIVDLLVCYALFRDKYERSLYTLPFFVTAIPVFLSSSFTFFVCMMYWR